MRQLPLHHPGTADHRSSARFLWWVARGQTSTLLGGMAFGIVWMSCQAVMPAVLGRAIDAGVAARDSSALLDYAGVMLLVGLVQAGSGIMRHRFAVTNWLTAAYRRPAGHPADRPPRRLAATPGLDRRGRRHRDQRPVRHRHRMDVLGPLLGRGRVVPLVSVILL